MFLPIPNAHRLADHVDATPMPPAQALVEEGWQVCSTFFRMEGAAHRGLSKLDASFQSAVEALPPGAVVLGSGYSSSVASTRHFVCDQSATKETDAIAIPTWIDDRVPYPPFEQRRYFASFRGALPPDDSLRQSVVDGLRDCPRSYCHIDPVDFHTSPSAEKAKYSDDYWKSLSETQFSLCPREPHGHSARLYESLAAGCIPILFADNAKLPLEGILPWSDLIVRVPESRAGEWPKVLEEWTSKRSTAELGGVSRHNRIVLDEWLHWRRLGRQLLVERVERAIKRAERRASTLSRDVLELPGMSSGKVRHFLNNLQPQRYLEVGVWRGSTFTSACAGNNLESATAIDNFSGFQDDDQGEARFLEQVHRHLPSLSFELKNLSFFDLPADSLPRNIDVYFYDGDHSYEAQRRAIVHAWPALQREAIIVIDDANMPGVMAGTRQGLWDVQAQVLHDWLLPAHFNGDTEQWWNGLYVAVVRKTE